MIKSPLVLLDHCASESVLPETHSKLQSTTADDLQWAAIVTNTPTSMQVSAITSTAPLHDMLGHLDGKLAELKEFANVLVVAGRSKKGRMSAHGTELSKLSTEKKTPLDREVTRTVGEVAASVMLGAPTTSIVIFESHLV